MDCRYALCAVLLVTMQGCARGGDAGQADSTRADSVSAQEADTAASTTLASDTGTAVASTAEDSGDPDSDLHRPVEISLTITSKNDRNGSYQATGTSRSCGRQRMSGFPMPKSYSVQFPYDGEHRIVDLVLIAPDLPTGGSTEKFSVDASVVNSRGGKPPSFVLNAGQRGETGKVTLTEENGTSRIVAEGRNGQNETMQLTIVCRPRSSSK